MLVRAKVTPMITMDDGLLRGKYERTKPGLVWISKNVWFAINLNFFQFIVGRCKPNPLILKMLGLEG